MPKIDLTEIEAAFNQDQDEADALILERWREHLKVHPEKGESLDLGKIRAGLRQHHGGPGPHPSGSSQEVHGSWGPDRIANSPTDFLVKIETENIPEEHLDGLERIDFTSNQFVLTREASGEISEAYGVYTPSERTITLASNADNISVFGGGTAIHEIGHHVHLSRLTDEGAAEWARISRGGQAAFISAYAQTNQGEHFAEAYRAYQRGDNHRKKLKALEPTSYKFMRGLKKYILPIGELAEFSKWRERYEG